MMQKRGRRKRSLFTWKEGVIMANKIPVSALIAEFQTMLREHWAYDWSGAQRGKVSCAGAFVYAYKQHGISISHGSNYMARNEVEALIPINVANIMPGMAAFKLRAPSDAKYDLPDKYRKGGASYNGDLNDYYHVGLVDTDTSQVLNAQSSSTGFVSSSISKGWSHVAYLKQVNYGTEEQASTPSIGVSGTLQTETVSSVAYVYAANGLPVKMRDKPSESCRLWTELPVGTKVTIRGKDSGGWTPVRWNAKDGYIMTKFLVAGEIDDTFYDVTFCGLTKAQAEKLVADYGEYRSMVAECHG